MQNPMEQQEEEVLRRREQAMEALIRHLPRLSTERCPCPSVNLARASFNRVQVIKALWPEYGADAKAMEALVVVLSCYTLAIWWNAGRWLRTGRERAVDDGCEDTHCDQ